MIQNFGFSELRWCHHKNVHEIQIMGHHHDYYLCEDCGDTFPVIGDDSEWQPKLLGAAVPKESDESDSNN